MDKKFALAKTMYQFIEINRAEEMIENYKWFSIASGIKDEEETLKLMKEIVKENYLFRIHRNKDTNRFELL